MINIIQFMYNLLAYLLGNMSLSKQARKRTFQELWEEKYFCCAQDDNVRCLLSSIVQKGTHKWNIKRYYDTVLHSKSAADAANLSIFTLCHVHCRLRCATSSWGHIKYMIADTWSNGIKWNFKFTLWMTSSCSLDMGPVKFWVPSSYIGDSLLGLGIKNK